MWRRKQNTVPLAVLGLLVLVSALPVVQSFSTATRNFRDLGAFYHGLCSSMEDSVDDGGTFPSPPDQPSRQDILARYTDQRVDPAPTEAVSATEGKSDETMIRPLAGGTSLMFEMARQAMLDWSSDRPQGNYGEMSTRLASSTKTNKSSGDALPRWHPHRGIVDSNPNFRTESPLMNNQGFARSIWRNVRKRNKPSLWMYALRTYDRMGALEANQTDRPGQKIQRSNVHHEGALLACAKLGAWERALEIIREVSETEMEQKKRRRQELQQLSSMKPSSNARPRLRVSMTENMVQSLIRAAVVASRNTDLNLDLDDDGETPRSDCKSVVCVRNNRKRRIPLDRVRSALQDILTKHCVTLAARHANPLASAYIKLGYVQDGRDVLETLLTNRTSGVEPEDGTSTLNIHDFGAKDKSSYSLLVESAVQAGDFGSAIDALADMTEAGLFPTSRHCNGWSEISERRTRPRGVRSWKKKRTDYWVESIL